MTIEHLAKKRFTLVSTVFNEASRLQQTISNLENQTILPDEIIITDGGSTDGTIKALQDWSSNSQIDVKIIVEKGCNVARGRNLAIAKASYDYIVSTDFGCIHTTQWFESLVTPFKTNTKLEVVGGTYGVMDKELTTIAAKAEYILQNAYDIKLDECYTVTSRAIAYKKYVWEEIGGYPEWLTLASDDSTFWRLIKKKDYNYYINPEKHVFWLRHESLKAFNKEAFRYGLGDGESRTNFKNLISHLIETLLRYSIPPILIISIFFPIALIVLPFSLFGLRSYKNAFKNYMRLKSSKYTFSCFIFSLILTETQRFYYLRAYFKGYFLSNAETKKEAIKLKQRLQ